MPGPTGTRPSQLAKPVPNQATPVSANQDAELTKEQLAGMEAIWQEFQQAPTQVNAPNMNNQQLIQSPPAQQDERLEQLWNQYMNSEAPVTSDEGAPLSVRFKAGFAQTDKEKVEFLKKELGPKNVRVQADQIQIKVGDRWTPYNPEGFDIGDIASLGREAVETIPSAIGGITGFFGAGPVGAAAGQAAGAAIGRGLGDVAQEALGVAIDEERNLPAEIATAGAIGGVLSGLGGVISRSVARRAAQRTALQAPAQFADEAVKEIDEITNFLGSKGYAQQIPGTNRYLLPSQISPDSPVQPDLLAFERQVADHEALRGAKAHIAKSYLNGVEKFFSDAGVDKAGKLSGKQFIATLNNVMDQEGMLIGELRKNFKAQAGERAAIPMTNLDSTMQKIASKFEDLGIPMAREGNRIPFLDTKNTKNAANMLKENRFATTGAEAQTILGKLRKATEELYNNEGRLTPDQLHNLYEDFSSIARTLDLEDATKYKFNGLVMDLRKAVAEDYKKALGTVTGQSKAYTDKLARFSELSNARANMGNLLEQNGLSSRAVAEKIFMSKTAPGQIENVKVFLRENPDAWDAIRAEGLEIIKDKAISLSGARRKVDGEALRKAYGSMSKEAKEALFGNVAEGDKVMNSLIILGNRIKDGSMEDVAKPENVKLMQAIIGGLTGSSFVALNKGMQALGGFMGVMGADDAVAKYLSKEGDNLLAGMKLPPGKLVRATRFIEGAINAAAHNTATREAIRNVSQTTGKEIMLREGDLD